MQIAIIALSLMNGARWRSLITNRLILQNEQVILSPNPSISFSQIQQPRNDPVQEKVKYFPSRSYFMA